MLNQLSISFTGCPSVLLLSPEALWLIVQGRLFSNCTLVAPFSPEKSVSLPHSLLSITLPQSFFLFRAYIVLLLLNLEKKNLNKLCLDPYVILIFWCDFFFKSYLIFCQLPWMLCNRKMEYQSKRHMILLNHPSGRLRFFQEVPNSRRRHHEYFPKWSRGQCKHFNKYLLFQAILIIYQEQWGVSTNINIMQIRLIPLLCLIYSSFAGQEKKQEAKQGNPQQLTTSLTHTLLASSGCDCSQAYLVRHKKPVN